MNNEGNVATTVAREGADVMTIPDSVYPSPPPKPLQQSYRDAARVLMTYFDEQGISYQPCSEQFGLCLLVRHEMLRGVTNARIRLGAATGVVSISVWMDDLQVAPRYAWMAKRLVDAVNEHCAGAQLGHSAMMQLVYARTQVWYANAELRPRDVVAAMSETGSVLLQTLLELHEVVHWCKRIDDGVEALVRWLKEAAERAAVEMNELSGQA